jgi:hypothetical protein
MSVSQHLLTEKVNWKNAVLQVTVWRCNMGKRLLSGICLAVCILFLTAGAGSVLKVQAANSITVSGTIASGTTVNLLYLSTSGGTMQIVLDAGTDASACKILVPGKSVTVTCYGGSDNYLHASKIVSNGTTTSSVTVNTSSTATVTGTAATGTADDILYLSTTGGIMQIKIDSNTDLGSCSSIVVGKSLVVVCARGSDAYMHAVKISDGTVTSGVGASTATVNGVSVVTLPGTVASGTTSSLLYFATSGGTMQIVMDISTDDSACRALVPGQAITVACYRGADAYMHAARITDSSIDRSSTVTLASQSVTVSGTVASGTTSNLLYLSTSGGVMQIKMDGRTNMNGSGAMILGQTVSVTCVGASDSYLHATSITH